MVGRGSKGKRCLLQKGRADCEGARHSKSIHAFVAPPEARPTLRALRQAAGLCAQSLPAPSLARRPHPPLRRSCSTGARWRGCTRTSRQWWRARLRRCSSVLRSARSPLLRLRLRLRRSRCSLRRLAAQRREGGRGAGVGRPRGGVASWPPPDAMPICPYLPARVPFAPPVPRGVWGHARRERELGAVSARRREARPRCGRNPASPHAVAVCHSVQRKLVS
jgi:hypothetical protein